ncbi:MAG: hypothetical protein GY940_21120 [bacterium]|nr:hypothetical protein [bacterium]
MTTAIISGYVFGLDGLGEPTVVSGTGDWTVTKHNGNTGEYMIEFDNPFALYANGVVNAVSAEKDNVAFVRDITNTYMRIQILDTSHRAVDSNFNFIVFGE